MEEETQPEPRFTVLTPVQSANEIKFTGQLAGSTHTFIIPQEDDGVLNDLIHAWQSGHSPLFIYAACIGICGDFKGLKVMPYRSAPEYGRACANALSKGKIHHDEITSVGLSLLLEIKERMKAKESSFLRSI